MKTIPLFSLLILSGTILHAQQIVGNSDLIVEKLTSKYPYSTAKIQYELSGDARGRSVLIFDRNGWRSLVTKQMKIERYGITSKEESIEYVDGDYTFTVNLDAGKGKKIENKNWSSLLSYKTNDEAISIIMEGQGGKLIGTDTILNRACRIWNFEKGAVKAVWEWQGIPLKTIKSLPGLSYAMEAISIEEEIPVSEDVFSLPDGITWQ